MRRLRHRGAIHRRRRAPSALRDASKYTVFSNLKRSSTDPYILIAKFTLDEVRAYQAAAAIVAPWISNMVMANMDYDGNGFLTPDEIRITLKGEAALSTTDIGALLKRAGADSML
jgi:hypothetical protein